MSKKDFELLKSITPLNLKLNQKNFFNFKNEDSLHGLGWTHSNGTSLEGIWSEGNVSMILFKIDKKINDHFNLDIKINSISTKDNDPLNFEIYLNETLYEDFSIKQIEDLENNFITLKLNKKDFTDDIVYLKFRIKNPVSKLELLKSPDARKLGLLIENIKIYN